MSFRCPRKTKEKPREGDNWHSKTCEFISKLHIDIRLPAQFDFAIWTFKAPKKKLNESIEQYCIVTFKALLQTNSSISFILHSKQSIKLWNEKLHNLYTDTRTFTLSFSFLHENSVEKPACTIRNYRSHPEPGTCIQKNVSLQQPREKIFAQKSISFRQMMIC